MNVKEDAMVNFEVKMKVKVRVNIMVNIKIMDNVKIEKEVNIKAFETVSLKSCVAVLTLDDRFLVHQYGFGQLLGNT